jgi:large subunit ribosomal protein L29
MVKKKDLKNMHAPELQKRLKELRSELMKSNSQIATGTIPKNPGQIKHTKKTIARILTLLNNKDKNKEENKKA